MKAPIYPILLYGLVMILLLLMYSCSSKSMFPIPVLVKDARLVEVTSKAIDIYNAKFGEIFIVTDSDDVMTQIDCEKDNWLETHMYAGYSYGDGRISIDCTHYTPEKLINIVGHELWHQLGFVHLENQECLMYFALRSGSMEDLICQEMVDQFNEVYGGFDERNYQGSNH